MSDGQKREGGLPSACDMLNTITVVCKNPGWRPITYFTFRPYSAPYIVDILPFQLVRVVTPLFAKLVELGLQDRAHVETSKLAEERVLVNHCVYQTISPTIVVHQLTSLDKRELRMGSV